MKTGLSIIDNKEYQLWLQHLCNEDEYPDFLFVQVPLAQLREMPILQARLANFILSANGEFVQVIDDLERKL